jgi:peptidoglycan hydrolase-like protein with peptidoglycan-binding domain
VAVRHGGSHVHVLAGRVNPDGEVWRDGKDYPRTMAAVRAVEREHGLVAVDGPGRVRPLPRRACPGRRDVRQGVNSPNENKINKQVTPPAETAA